MVIYGWLRARREARNDFKCSNGNVPALQELPTTPMNTFPPLSPELWSKPAAPPSFAEQHAADIRAGHAADGVSPASQGGGDQASLLGSRAETQCSSSSSGMSEDGSSDALAAFAQLQLQQQQQKSTLHRRSASQSKTVGALGT